jgi:hypothetical protein
MSVPMKTVLFTTPRLAANWLLMTDTPAAIAVQPAGAWFMIAMSLMPDS